MSARRAAIFGAAARTPQSPDARVEAVKTDLTLRLRNVCKDLSEEDFADLVAVMTREQLRSERDPRIS